MINTEESLKTIQAHYYTIYREKMHQDEWQLDSLNNPLYTDDIELIKNIVE